MSHTTLLDLPSEILTSITSYFDTLDTHVYFSKTCTRLESLYEEEHKWRDVLFHFNYGRPRACVLNTWKKYANALVKHANKCIYCKGVHAEHSKLKEEPRIILDSDEAIASHATLDIAHYLERRPSEDDWIYPDSSHLVASLGGAKWTPLEERCIISYEGQGTIQSEFKKKTGKAMSRAKETKQSCLKSHVNALSLFATNIPVKQVKLQNFLDAESPYFDMLMDLNMDLDNDGDYFASGPSILYPSVVTNPDGLTCYDVMRAGANWKIHPGENAFFGGLALDKASATISFQYVGSC